MIEKMFDETNWSNFFDGAYGSWEEPTDYKTMTFTSDFNTIDPYNPEGGYRNNFFPSTHLFFNTSLGAIVGNVSDVSNVYEIKS